MRVSIALGIVSVSVIVGIFMLWADKQSQVRSTHNGPETLFKPSTTPDIAPLPKTEAMHYVWSALSAQNMIEVQDSFHLGSSTPEDVLAFLSNHITQPPRECEHLWVGPIITDGLHVEMGLIDLGGQMPNHRILMLAPDAERGWKLDFASFARVTTPSWEKILQDPHAGGIVRISITSANYYNGMFSEEDWACFRLVSQDIDTPVYGYCRKNSPVLAAVTSLGSKAIYKSAENDGALIGQMRTTLEIKAPKKALQNQFEITRVIAEDWVTRDTIYQDKF